MKRILLLLLVPIVLVSGVVCQEPEAGIGPPPLRIFSIRYTDEVFSVLLPSHPAVTTSKVSRKDGKERKKRLITVTMNSVVYSIEVFENLKPELQPLEEFIAESNAGFQFDPATERNLTVDDFPGKEYSSQTKTTTTVVQFLATEDRLFRFAATGPAAAAPVIKDFFTSIRLKIYTGGMGVSESSAGSNTSEKIYTGRDVDEKVRLLTKPEPAYTKDARDNKVEGTVVLVAVFSKTGRVENIRVFSGLPYGLTEQSIKAARQIRFVPAMKDGKAVSMHIQLEYNFSL